MLLLSVVSHYELPLDGITILPGLSNIFHNLFQNFQNQDRVENALSETFTTETFQVSPFLFKATSC